MDVTHVFLGTLAMNVDINLKRRENVYWFILGLHRMTMLVATKHAGFTETKPSGFLTITSSEHEKEAKAQKLKCICITIVRGFLVQPIIEEFQGLMSEDLPNQLPPMTDICWKFGSH